MSYSADVRAFIVDNFLFGDDEGVTEDTQLFESGFVDSTGILELVAFIEKQYAVLVADDELVPENFKTLTAIARYIDAKKNNHAELTTPIAHE